MHQVEAREADFSGAVMTDIRLTEARLIKACLEGTNLSGSNLSGALLYDADLRSSADHRTDLGNVNLQRADLSYAKLQWCALPKG